MKRITLILAVCCMVLAGCAQNNNKNENKETTQNAENQKEKEMKTLVVYFSATGTTKAAAQRLAK